MKKNFIIVALSIFVVIAVTLSYNYITGNNKSDSDLTTVKLAEVTHSVFYAPLYVAIENGYFEEEGIDLELILTSGADAVSAAVISGDVNIGFAGAESAVYIYEGGEEDYLQIFSGLTNRDGQFIVSREYYENFTLEDLIGKEILVGRSSGTPALNFLYSLDNYGISEDELVVNTSVEFAALSGTFISGEGDFVNLFEPNATLLENEGYGYIVASVGEFSGEVPYTTFYANKSYIEENEELLVSFTNAIAKALTYVLETDSYTVAEDIIDQFPDQSISELTSMIENYKVYDCWLENPYITEETFNNLEDFLIKYELIEDVTSYEDLVYNLYTK